MAAAAATAQNTTRAATASRLIASCGSRRGGSPQCDAGSLHRTISDDATTYTFHLRPGMRWSDGEPFTADDIMFWYEDIASNKELSPAFPGWLTVGGEPVVVEKVDDYTVKITLNQAEAPFLSTLAMQFSAIQSKEYADAMLKAGTPEKIDQEPVGTGPFQLVQYQKDAIIRFKSFPEHWAGKAKIDDLVFAITTDSSVRWAKLQKGECHVMPYPNPADLPAMRADANVTLLTQPGLNIGYLAYNTTKKPFDDVRVRKAINMAINKQAIVDGVYLSTGVAAKNPIPPAQWSYNNAIKDDPFDQAAAQKMLAAAGYPNGFSTDLWAMPVQRPYNPNAKRIAELMQADLAKIGVKAEIKSFEWGEYRKRMQAGEHQMGMLGWTGDNGDPDNFLHTLLGCDAAKSGASNLVNRPQAMRNACASGLKPATVFSATRPRRSPRRRRPQRKGGEPWAAQASSTISSAYSPNTSTPASAFSPAKWRSSRPR